MKGAGRALAAGLIVVFLAHDMGASGFFRPAPPVLPTPARLLPPPPPTPLPRGGGDGRAPPSTPPPPPASRAEPIVENTRASVPAPVVAPSLGPVPVFRPGPRKEESSLDLIRPLQREEPVVRESPSPRAAARPAVRPPARRTPPTPRPAPARAWMVGRLKTIPYLADMVSRGPGAKGRLGAMAFRQDSEETKD